jgi:hypothetical protein
MGASTLYNCAITLVFLTHEQNGYDLFDRTCSMLLRLVEDFPFASLLLRGLRIIIEHLRLPLPSSATLYHHNLALPTDKLRDVPISFAIPLHMWVSGDGMDSDQVGLEFGKVVTDWSFQEW